MFTHRDGGRYLIAEKFAKAYCAGADGRCRAQRCSHTTCIDWMLPGIAPTNKTVEASVVVIIKFANNKIAHEHIYWDQTSVLMQIGLLTP